MGVTTEMNARELRNFKGILNRDYEHYRQSRQVECQLDTTIQSYDSLMEKLEVDISVVEKEKQKIVEQ